MIVTLFESVKRAYTRPEQVMAANWLETAEFLTVFHEVKAKEDAWLFNLWQFDPCGELGRQYVYQNGERTEVYNLVPGTVRRCKANATGVWGLVLDYDGNKTIQEAIQELEYFNFALYTTFRHSSTTHKFRVVIPFDRCITRDEFRLKEASISETFKEVDHASFSESQSFYLHSGADPTIAFAKINHGIFLDPDLFENEVIEAPTLSEPKVFDGDNDFYRQKLIESLVTCSGLHYAGVGTSHGVLTLVALCKSAGMSYDDYDAICWQISAQDSSLKDSGQRKQAWAGWKPYSGITAKTREDFIRAYNGTSQFGIKQETLTAQERKAAVIKKWGNGSK